MLRVTNRALLALILVGTLNWSLASSAAIGLAMAKGSFQVDNSRVSGNITLFDGNIIETAQASSELQINGGVQMRLAAASRAAVFERRLVLEKGIGQWSSSGDYQVEARELRVSSVAPRTLARVEVAGPRRVLVAALAGAVRVSNAQGVVVANLEAGRAASFELQAAGAAAPTRVSGCLLRKDGKFVIMDQTAHVTLQLQGEGLETELGNRVEITGIADPAGPSLAGASQLLNVSGVKRVSKGGCASVAKKMGAAAGAGAAGAGAAAAGAGAAAAAGLSTAATVAIVGGVAVAASVGGLAAAGALPGQGEPERPASR